MSPAPTVAKPATARLTQGNLLPLSFPNPQGVPTSKTVLAHAFALQLPNIEK